MERMHPEDMRTIVAAICATTERGITNWAPCLRAADDLIEGIAKNAKPSPVADLEWGENTQAQMLHWRDRAQRADADLVKAKRLLRDMNDMNESHRIEEAEVRNRLKPILDIFGVTEWGSNAFVLKVLLDDVQCLKAKWHAWEKKALEENARAEKAEARVKELEASESRMIEERDDYLERLAVALDRQGNGDYYLSSVGAGFIYGQWLRETLRKLAGVE